MNRIAATLVRYATLASMLAFVAPAAAQVLDINLSNDSALFRYIVQERDSSGFGNKEIDLGLVYNTDDVIVGMFGAQLVAEAGSRSPGLDAGIGFKLFGARSKDDDDIYALTVGGQLHFVPPPWPRVGFSLQGFYSPDVVTFGDADKFFYVSSAVEYRVLPQAMIYLGYRKMRAGLESGDSVTVESGGHLGIQLEF